MGELLQIRVMASTFRPEAVARRWPKLAQIAWGGKEKKQGVLELVADLADLVRLGDLPEDRKHELQENGLYDLLKAKGELESALADRDPQKADRLSYTLEDGLDELEKKSSSV